ncbi:MAG: hypothetical protein ACP5G5_03370 [Thermoplasmata archaeon]|jgi:hypothetical protein|nr:hypothetical protein [Thermoplasmatales archaeon]PMP75398.1 MAG: hypothetical protein C0180_01460 [Aciduliprofundum sp.]
MKGIRFSDTDDFNSIHDNINILLLENYHIIVDFIVARLRGSGYDITYKNSSIMGEPRLCKIAFPDAVISINFLVNFTFHNLKRDVTLKFAVEIKSHIKSFGETLRQLQIYRECLENLNSREWRRKTGQQFPFRNIFPVILISPDHRFDGAFISQGFHVLDPDILGISFKEKREKNLDDFQR